MKHAIPDDWDGQAFCRFAICWPDSTLWRALLRGLITEPARGFFWDEKTGSIRGVLADFRQTMDQNLELPEVIMACGDTGLLEGLQAIAQAIAKSNANATANANATTACGCSQTIINQGGGIQGSITSPTTGDIIPIYGTEPPIILPPGEIPEGYETQEEYDLDKCQLANLITDDFIESIRRLGAITTFNTVALAGLLVAAVVGSIAFPPAAIPTAVGVMIVCAGATGVLAGLLLGMQEKRQEIVCVLYNGDSIDSIIATLSDIFDGIIALIPVTGTVAVALKTLAILLMNSDTLNQLFRKTAHANYPDADCSSCGCNLRMDRGSLDLKEGNVYTFSSAFAPGSTDYQLIDIRIEQSLNVFCGNDARFELLSLTGFQPSTNPNNDDFWMASTVEVVYSSDTPPDGEFDVIRVSFAGHPDYPFEMTARINVY